MNAAELFDWRFVRQKIQHFQNSVIFYEKIAESMLFLVHIV